MDNQSGNIDSFAGGGGAEVTSAPTPATVSAPVSDVNAELVAELVAALRHALKLLEPFDDPELSLGLGSNALAPIRAAMAKAEASRLTPSAIGAEGWRLIESAPKDGTPILYRNEHTTAGACKWWTAEELAADEGGSPDEFAPGWYEVDDPDSEVVPTEWMPLPAPPTAQEG